MSTDAEDRRTFARFQQETGDRMDFDRYLRLREFWRSHGGHFHGPNIEHGTMPEAQLLQFLDAVIMEFGWPPGV